MKKRILLLTPFFYPNIGGAETFAKSLADEMRKENGVFVVTYMPFRGNAPEIEKKKNLYICRLHWLFKPDAVWRGTTIKHILNVAPKMYKKADAMCRDIQFDYIQSMGVISALVVGILKWKYKIKVFGCTLALYDLEHRPTWFKVIVRWIFNRMDKVFVEGENGRKDLINGGVAPEKIEIFYHWVDQDVFNKEGRIENKTITNVLFVGRPIKEKGIEIVKAVEHRLQNRRNINFQYVENSNPGLLPQYYKWADILVVPSLYAEGFVRVIAEAASCGCAIVSSNCGSLPEQVQRFGIVCSPMIEMFTPIISMFADNHEALERNKTQAYDYAVKNYSNRNASVFLKEYR